MDALISTNTIGPKFDIKEVKANMSTNMNFDMKRNTNHETHKNRNLNTNKDMNRIAPNTNV